MLTRRLTRRSASISALVLTVAALLFFYSVGTAQATGGAATSGGAAQGAASANPFEGDAEAVTAGQALFTGALGCYGCHGTAGGGGMGPSLVDATWVYGNDDVSLYTTVHDGRPNGMPAFGEAATEEQIWQVVSFVRSLGQQR